MESSCIVREWRESVKRVLGEGRELELAKVGCGCEGEGGLGEGFVEGGECAC